jgi:hypothetical protein
VAAKGKWISEDTLELEIRSLGDGYITTHTVNFAGDNIDITAKSNIGADQSFTGTLNMGCK